MPDRDPDSMPYSLALRLGRILSVKCAAKRLDVAASTLDRWIRAGHVNARRHPNGYRYFLPDDLDSMLGKKTKENSEH